MQILDETFANAPSGWPNKADGTAWYANGAYWLQARKPGAFVAVDAPGTAALDDGIVSARFRKSGGPPGGGYGIIIADQGPQQHDGVYQGGRFIVFEAGDQGTIGAWQRDEDHWIDLVSWTPSGAVRTDNAPNELSVQAQGRQVTFLVNNAEVAHITTDLPAGRVGVFVGGDGNDVALEHFNVRSGSSRGVAAPKASATATPQPTASLTPVVDALLAQLDTAWAQARWPEVQSLLDQVELVAPSALDIRDKRYAAHVAAGQALLSKGDRADAATEFTRAANVDPSRGEARNALIALSPTPTPAPSLPGADQPLPQFLVAVLNDIDEFWTSYFERRGEQYEPARRYAYSERTMTRCGPAIPGLQGSFYCVVDSGLYLDIQYLESIRTTVGDFPVASLVAHEVGHHVQHLFGITKVNAYALFGQTFSREIELQADCLAGVWSKSAIGRKLATPDDITNALTVAWESGDPSWASQRSADAHGTPDDRSGAFLKGFNGSTPATCGLR